MLGLSVLVTSEVKQSAKRSKVSFAASRRAWRLFTVTCGSVLGQVFVFSSCLL